MMTDSSDDKDKDIITPETLEYNGFYKRMRMCGQSYIYNGYINTCDCRRYLFSFEPYKCSSKRWNVNVMNMCTERYVGNKTLGTIQEFNEFIWKYFQIDNFIMEPAPDGSSDDSHEEPIPIPKRIQCGCNY